MKAMLVRREK